MQKFSVLSRYAPEDVSTDAAKRERFMEGLNQTLQYSLVVCDCPSFPDLVNKALMLEDKRRALEDTRKRASWSAREVPATRSLVRGSQPRPSQPISNQELLQLVPTLSLSSMPIQGQLSTPIPVVATRSTFQTKSLALDVVSPDTSQGCAPTRSLMPRAPMRRTKDKAAGCHQGTQLFAIHQIMGRGV